MPRQATSWKEHVVWGEYQRDVILPNLLRLMEIQKGEKILDLGCGAGLFAHEFFKAGAEVTGVDLSEELIAQAKKRVPEGKFFVASAEDLSFFKEKSIDQATAILSIQNIDRVDRVFKEAYRVLAGDGRMFLVLNHPAFRVLKGSEWGYDEAKNIQYRRIDFYLSEAKEKIQMHPGDAPKDTTISFHRPLQYYFKLLSNSGFCVTRLEEWISPKKSLPGKRAGAENRARKEFPLFLLLQCAKHEK